MINSSITRLTGFASGLDTESIIKKLMDAESVSLNKLKQNEQKQTWLSDTYRQWNADLFSFRTNTLLNMKLSGAYNTFDVSSSQENAISAKASGSSIAGTYTVAVKNLAKSATITGNTGLDPAKKLGDPAQGAAQLTADTKISLDVYSDPANPASLQSADIDIKTTDSIKDVVAKINGAKDKDGKNLGLQAYYDETLQQFSIKTKETGAATKISLRENTSTSGQSFLGNTLGIEPAKLSVSGENADIIFNGKEITTLTSNEATIMGIQFTFKSPTVDESGTTVSSTVNVSRNVDGVVKNITDFIEKYNSLLDKMNTTLNETAYRDYQPLTDDQRSEMSEKEIELWEGKAKSGLLRGDSILSGLVNKMRSAMTSVVDNGSVYNSLASIGISSRSYQDKGKLYIDETKLREALQKDPEAVQNLFSQTGDTEKGTNGLLNCLSDSFETAVEDLTAKAGSAGNSPYDQSVIGKLLTNIQNDITTQTDRLSKKEDQYYSKFAAMEQAISQFNSQSTWLSQQMGQ